MDQPFSNIRAHPRQRITRLLALLLLAPGVSSCSLLKPPVAQLTPPMPVQAPLRKQVLQGYMPFGSIGWVGNDKVIFHGFPSAPQTDNKSLYLWNLRERPRILLSRSHHSCTVGDQIQTLQLNGKNQNRTVRLRAPDFKPQPQAASQAAGPGIQDPASCEWITRPKPLNNHTWLPLAQGEGFLDFGKRDGKTNSFNKVFYLSKDFRTYKATGIYMPKPMAPMAIHASHDGTYLVYDMHQSHTDKQLWIAANHRRIWRLNGDLQGQPLRIPAGPWVDIGSGTIAFLPRSVRGF
ncbi:hypothetical protein [Synechococcus sp. CBW1004]|uniref:hypothetical protein n=1 Tax=Synechococcus sp. CBW1004 TaxID=1353136 RepID=UPI0018CD31A4|nr:hypothetical protein [Synechococcus sp. CBW1004]QPN62961.1 hypothetical protein H8F25_15205 [Synechococcus sp. CBW1004]